MGIRRQLILTACIVGFGLTSVPPHVQMVNQAVISSVNDEGEIRENLRNLFNSIANNDTKKGEIHCGILKEEIVRVQHVFDEMKEELHIAQNRNADRKRNFYEKSNVNGDTIAIKRETNENALRSGKLSEKLEETVEIKPEQRLATLLNEFLDVLSDKDKKKRKLLMKSYSRFSPPNATDCYFNAYGAFMAHCCHFFYQLESIRQFKYLFHRACEAHWLTEDKVILKVRMTCESKPHLRTEFTTTRYCEEESLVNSNDDNLNA